MASNPSQNQAPAVGLTVSISHWQLSSNNDNPDRLASPRQNQRQLNAIDYLSPLDLRLTQAIALDIVILVDEQGQAELLEDYTKIQAGQISQEKANQLVKAVLQTWEFTPTMTANQAVMQSYRLALKIQPIF